MLVFIILVNYLIVYIGNSYQNVMDGALLFKYKAICQNSKEFAIVKQKFFGAKLVVPFVLVANVNEEGDDASFGGLVSQITDFVKSTSRSLKKEIDSQNKEMESHIKKKYSNFNTKVAESQSEILKEIKQTSEAFDAGITKLKENTDEVKVSLHESVEEQKDNVEEEFNNMWNEMMVEFESMSQEMRDNMNTVRKEFSDVNADVTSFGDTMK